MKKEKATIYQWEFERRQVVLIGRSVYLPKILAIQRSGGGGGALLKKRSHYNKGVVTNLFAIA